VNIQAEKSGKELTLHLDGWLDTITSPELAEILKKELDDITVLNLDFSDLEYVSSAGLRVLLSTQKIMNTRGNMTILHANKDIKEMFEFTGFLEVLHLVD